jgi:16S rRNA (cytidine1402-2'-O)-methyltransferase
MSLTIVPTPLGNFGDITLRARQALADCTAVIAEEHRPASTLLKKIGLEQKEIYLLNEHSKKDDLQELLELCRTANMTLISDCGTPNFCDPGAALIKLLRQNNIDVNALPGPSSLMTLLSLTSERLDTFVFQGFLPADREVRQTNLNQLKQEKRAQIIFETPYRMAKLLEELAMHMPNRRALLGLDLTTDTQKIIEGPLGQIAKQVEGIKAEPVLLIYAQK